MTLDDTAAWSVILAQFHTKYQAWLDDRTFANEDHVEACRRGKIKPTRGGTPTHETDASACGSNDPVAWARCETGFNLEEDSCPQSGWRECSR